MILNRADQLALLPQMEEVLLSLYHRSPIVHSVQDELVLRGDSELQGLREILTTFKNSSPTDNILVFTCIKPCESSRLPLHQVGRRPSFIRSHSPIPRLADSVAVVKIARKLEEHVTGSETFLLWLSPTQTLTSRSSIVFAKQRPLDDIPLAEILADMDVMEEIQKLALARLDAMRPPSTMK